MSDEKQPQSLQYGNYTIHYELRVWNSERLKVEVFPDLRVVVNVPAQKPMEEVRSKIRKKARWIRNCQQEYSKFHPLPVPKKYRSGETIYYLGRQYILKIVREESPKVKLYAGCLWVYVSDPKDKIVVRKMIEDWYTRKAKSYFPERMAQCMKKLGMKPNERVNFQIRKMKNRWGSCSVTGRVTLNPELIKVPSSCIDYVIIHELCHLSIHNHSPAFYRLLEEKLPDWREKRARLNAFGSKA